MNPEELLNWLKKLIVWTPHGSVARTEIQGLIDRLKQHLGRT
jgi:hypothetical protein